MGYCHSRRLNVAQLTIGEGGDVAWTPASTTAAGYPGLGLRAQYNTFEADENTIGLWHCDEGSGSVLGDASANERDTSVNSSKWEDGWLGTSALRLNTNHVANLPLMNVPIARLTGAYWVRRNTELPIGGRQWVYHSTGWSADDSRGFSSGFKEYSFWTEWQMMARVANVVKSTGNLPKDFDWHQLVFSVEPGGIYREWYDGALRIDSTLDAGKVLSPGQDVGIGYTPEGAIDLSACELFLTESLPFPGTDFEASRWRYLSDGDCTLGGTPTAVASGIGCQSVQAVDLGATGIISGLSWAETAASSDERLQSIEVDDGAGYQTVWTYGGAVDVSGIAAASTYNLRITQRHSTDTVHEFAHILESLTLDYSTGGYRRPPLAYRMGPRIWQGVM